MYDALAQERSVSCLLTQCLDLTYTCPPISPRIQLCEQCRISWSQKHFKGSGRLDPAYIARLRAALIEIPSRHNYTMYQYVGAMMVIS
jgi:hypothetical protein